MLLNTYIAPLSLKNLFCESPEKIHLNENTAF